MLRVRVSSVRRTREVHFTGTSSSDTEGMYGKEWLSCTLRAMARRQRRRTMAFAALPADVCSMHTYVPLGSPEARNA